MWFYDTSGTKKTMWFYDTSGTKKTMWFYDTSGTKNLSTHNAQNTFLETPSLGMLKARILKS